MGSASAGLLKRESCSNLPLPMNLISAKNEQKAVVALANTLPIKQQLPMKLAKLGAAMGSSGGHATGGNSGGGGGNISSHSSPHGNVNASPTGGGLVQQLLPLRLSESLEHKRASPKVPSSTDPFKPKLSSSSFSPPASKSEDFVAGHSRTGSSPASIQMLSPRHHHYHTTTSTTTSSSSTASAGNMHPPKIPDKPASLLLQQAARGSPQLPPPPAGHHHHHHHQAQPPPKVHDPETNQEIVFL
jgi:hypothetical protein